MNYSNKTYMHTSEVFQCNFAPISEQHWLLEVSQEGIESNLKLKVKIFDNDLLMRAVAKVPDIATDLLEIAIAVYAVDRSIKPDQDKHCVVKVNIPVRCPEAFDSPNAMQALLELLYWYTGYEWVIKFSRRKMPKRDAEISALFDWFDPDQATDVALWSGGLDCLAGLLNRAIDDENRQFVLCGTGNNKNVYALQAKIVSLLPESISNRVKLSRVRYGIKIESGMLPSRPRLRSRGFTFMVIGAVCACLEGRSILQVYENGIGALNLRFRESEIGLNHAHSVHPRSLMMIAQWISQLLERQIEIKNPFMFQTKAQMCEVFRDENLLDIAFTSQTCDRKHRKTKVKQCGRCSSCILRRQAFASIGVIDNTRYVYDDKKWLYGIAEYETVENGNHIPAALHQVMIFEEFMNSENPWRSFARHFDTLGAHVVDQTATYYGLSEVSMRNELISLFEQYVTEWQQLRSQYDY